MKRVILIEEVYPYPRLVRQHGLRILPEPEADLPWWLVLLWAITHRLHVFCQREIGKRSDYLEWQGHE